MLEALQANSFEECLQELDGQLGELDNNLTVGFTEEVPVEQDNRRELADSGKQSSGSQVSILQLIGLTDIIIAVINALLILSHL